MHEYTLKNPQKMGDYDAKYGQSYWSYVEGSDIPVKFNLTKDDVENGSKIEAEEYSVKKSSKGNEYQQLKKVKVVGGSTVTHAKPKREFQPKDQNTIRAQWAIGQSVSFHMSSGTMQEIEDTAKTFYQMVDRVKED